VKRAKLQITHDDLLKCFGLSRKGLTIQGVEHDYEQNVFNFYLTGNASSKLSEVPDGSFCCPVSPEQLKKEVK
jgi:hypothetical protein